MHDNLSAQNYDYFGMLTKVDEGGCFNESSLEMMGFDGGQQWNDVPHQSTPRNSVHHGAYDLTDITFFVDLKHDKMLRKEK
jgi:hypothetical protein